MHPSRLAGRRTGRWRFCCDPLFSLHRTPPGNGHSSSRAALRSRCLMAHRRAIRLLDAISGLTPNPLCCASSQPPALAIPDLAALIFSAYCSGIRGDFHPPACVMAAKSMSSSARSCAAPSRVECPLTSATNLAGILIHCATRLKIGASCRNVRHRRFDLDQSTAEISALIDLRMLEPDLEPFHRLA